jgi:hypothetical protein
MKRDNGFHGFIPDAPPNVLKMLRIKAGPVRSDAGRLVDHADRRLNMKCKNTTYQP